MLLGAVDTGEMLASGHEYNDSVTNCVRGCYTLSVTQATFRQLWYVLCMQLGH